VITEGVRMNTRWTARRSAVRAAVEDVVSWQRVVHASPGEGTVVILSLLTVYSSLAST